MSPQVPTLEAMQVHALRRQVELKKEKKINRHVKKKNAPRKAVTSAASSAVVWAKTVFGTGGAGVASSHLSLAEARTDLGAGNVMISGAVVTAESSSSS